MYLYIVSKLCSLFQFYILTRKGILLCCLNERKAQHDIVCIQYQNQNLDIKQGVTAVTYIDIVSSNHLVG